MTLAFERLGPGGLMLAAAAVMLLQAGAVAGLCRAFGVRPPWPLAAAGAGAISIGLFASALSPPAMAAGLVLGTALWALALIDLAVGRLPDAITLPLIVMGLWQARALQGADGGDQVLGAIGGFAGFALVGWVYRRIRGRDGLGLGDAKLMAVAGAWLGWRVLPLLVLLACLLATLWILGQGVLGRKVTATTRLPLGPALIASFWALEVLRPQSF